MGIESDQLVYDYLSRVGDLAQQQQLSSGTRMRLVSELRSEIERQRRTQAADTPGAVRRIIGTLGTPDELVEAAARTGVAAPVPEAREEDRPQGRPEARPEATGIPAPRRPKLRRKDPLRKAPLRKDPLRKGASPEPEPEPAPPAPAQPSAPHRAGTDELGADGGEPEWWSVEPGPFGEFGPGTEVPGFRGGVEIPAILRPPAPEEDEYEDEDEEPAEPEEDDEEEAALPERRRRRRWLPKVRRSRGEAAAASPRGFAHPMLLLAAALLVTGAVMGSLPVLGGGWLLAYLSRKLSRAEAKWAVMGLPGVVAAAAVVWLWGRMEGRWGAPIPEHGMADALSDVWPVTLRTAAVASAAFLVWRARRR